MRELGISILKYFPGDCEKQPGLEATTLWSKIKNRETNSHSLFIGIDRDFLLASKSFEG